MSDTSIISKSDTFICKLFQYQPIEKLEDNTTKIRDIFVANATVWLSNILFTKK